MRTLFTLIFTLFLFLNTHAQIAPGDKFLGGSFSLNFTERSISTRSTLNPDNTGVNFSFSPRFGMGIKNNLALGLAASFSHAKLADDVFFFSSNPTPIIVEGQKTTIYNIGPFLRYYASFSESAGFILDFNTGIGGGKIEQRQSSSSLTKIDLFNVDIGLLPAFYFFFSPRFCLEASFGGLSYGFTRSKQPISSSNDSVNKSSTLGLTLGSQLSIRFNYYFLKK